MSLEPGRRLAHYEIVESIGRGGMGEVYRARDTKLGREVAIKVLPEEFTRDREQLDRFSREARLLAQVNHTNIATLHGLEEADGVQFLVMELVDGETLHARIARGRIPVDEATRLFVQIADGLEAAHAKGIVHRDLKPANIKIAFDGGIKILDFGLAKAVASDEEPGQSESPTMTRGTADGVILGTAPYMSPEQARGKEIDEQTDIWAFGCCLYEALTARAAFRGETVSDTLARVLEREPNWDRLPAATPTSVHTLLHRTLRKDKRERLHHIGDARLELESGQEVAAPAPSRSRYTLVALVASVGALALLWGAFARDADIPLVTRSLISAGPSTSIALGYFSSSVAISPNGRYVAYVGTGETSRLYLRAVDRFDATPVDDSDGAQTPFFSPDSAWLGYWVDGSLMRVSVTGGAPTRITRTNAPRGADWGADGVIVFGGQLGGLQRVLPDSGVPEALTEPDRDRGEVSHRLPDVLPGSKAALFTLVTGDIESFDDAAIALLSLETGEYEVLLSGGTNPRYCPSGRVVYARAGRLWAVPFDLASLTISGVPGAVVEDVAMSNVRSGPAEFSIASTGDLVYAAGGSWGANRRVAWVDRHGNSDVLVPGPGAFEGPRLSPDGRRIAFFTDGANTSVWIYDRDRTTLTRFASGFDNAYPIWTPTGSHVTFGSKDGVTSSLVSKRADGSEGVEVISQNEIGQRAGSWSPDGTMVVFTSGGQDVWVQSVGGDEGPKTLLAEAHRELHPTISPDGAWIAYTSDESGELEVYLRPFPELGGKIPVSTDGGTHPRWLSTGRALYYWNVDRMMVVDIGVSGEPAGRPRMLFEATDALSFLANPIYDGYDVASDGEHFVMIEEIEPDPAPVGLNLVTNWASELERLAPNER